VGVAYNQALNATGAGTITWTLTTGALPAGLALGASAIAGTPITSGQYSFTLTATDADGATAQPFTLIIYPALDVLTDSLPSAVQSAPYGEVVEAWGGNGTYTWSISAGALPAGITLSTAGTPAASLSGTPSASGTFNFTVRAQDSLGNAATSALTLIVLPPVSIMTTWLAEMAVGQNIIAPIFASGGLGNYTWDITVGNLPSGLSVNASGAPYTFLYGTAAIASTHTFTLRARDSALNAATRQLEIRVHAAGTIVTAAGDGATYLPGGPNGDGGQAALAHLNSPQGLAFDASGNMFVAERGGYRVRRIDASTGVITTVAGDGMQGIAGGLNSIFPAPSTRLATTAQFVGITALAVDSQGRLNILDGDGHALHRVQNGIITTIAGTGAAGFSGDTGQATAAQLNGSYGFAFLPNGDIVIADTFNYRIRKIIAATGVIDTLAGSGIPGTSGDGLAGTSANIAFITGICTDPSGNVFIGGGMAGSPDIHSRVRKIDTGGVITTYAGTGVQGYSGDGGLAVNATFNRAASICCDAQGNLYICDMRAFGASNNRIRVVDASTGVVNTICGGPALGFGGDGAAASAASISGPFTPAVDHRGNLYFCDTGNNRVRKILKP
jgi:sugar lactone lactonase YvrE